MRKNKGKRQRQSAWLSELNDLVRGVCGGFLFGIPLLYTMEVWWIGSFAEPVQRMSCLVVTFVGVFLLNRTAGFRKTTDIRFKDAAMDSVEAIAIGIICAFCVLVLLQEIKFEMNLSGALGKVIFEAMPFSIGVALSRSYLSGDRTGNQNEQNGNNSTEKLPPAFADLGATFIGATIFAFNVAPTDEIPMLAAAISPPWLLAIMAASLLISYGIVFEAGFTNQAKRKQQKSVFQRPISETVISYLVSLIAAALLLCFFQKVSFEDPWQMWLSFTLILGLPATVGGAAGRLIV